jgi:hypothetical protein
MVARQASQVAGRDLFASKETWIVGSERSLEALDVTLELPRTRACCAGAPGAGNV